jgi:hypothetical protein
MLSKNAMISGSEFDPYEARVREVLGRVIPRGARDSIARALSEKLRRRITVKRLGNLIEPGKQTPRMSLSTAKALVEVLTEASATNATPLRRFLNSDEELCLLQENMQAIQRMFERIARGTRRP